MQKETVVRKVRPREVEAACRLAWETFLQFEAPAYPPEGARTFRAFLQDQELLAAFQAGSLPMWGCFAGGELVGMAAMSNQSHFCLVFVKSTHHRQGVGRALMETALRDRREKGIGRVTLNASPYGVGFYHRLGFTDTGAETMADGIRYTPMEYRLA